MIYTVTRHLDNGKVIGSDDLQANSALEALKAHLEGRGEQFVDDGRLYPGTDADSLSYGRRSYITVKPAAR